MRRPRRVAIQFWKLGDPHPFPGFTTNISMTGMFIGTRSPCPRGTRVRVEVIGERGFMIEGVVAHARKIRGELAQLTQSGMGIRFLSVEELVRDLLPGAAGGEASAVAPPESLAGDLFEEIPDPPSSPDPPAPLASAPPPPAPAPPAPAAPPPAVVDSGVFTVRFPNSRHFLEVFERDIKNGGLFVSTRFPGRLAEVVTIELHPPDSEPIRVRARVVQRFEPHGASLLAGMGVELLDSQGIYEQLRPVAARLSGR